MSNAVLKLTNGETLIGDVTPSNDENYINVVNPYVIRTGVSEDSRLIMSMTKWVESAEETVQVKADHVITVATASTFLSRYFEEVKESEDEELDYDVDLEDNEDFTFTVSEGSNSVH